MSAEAFRQTVETPHDRVIVALDNMNWLDAGEVMNEVGPFVGMAKANAIAQQRGWKHAVSTIGFHGLRTMADAKYKDVPSTMKNHVREATECLPRFITVFADNNPAALTQAVQGREDGRRNLEKRAAGVNTKGIGGLLGVTVLTSIGSVECQSIYGEGRTQKKVEQFAFAAAAAGLDGIVCSGQELEMIRSHGALDNLLTVVPGMVPEWAAKPDDQKRVMTPGQALQSGADYLVIGRAITKPPEGMSRAEAAERIAAEILEAA